MNEMHCDELLCIVLSTGMVIKYELVKEIGDKFLTYIFWLIYHDVMPGTCLQNVLIETGFNRFYSINGDSVHRMWC